MHIIASLLNQYYSFNCHDKTSIKQNKTGKTMSRLDEILIYKALAFKHGPNNSSLLDHFLDQESQPEELAKVTKNVCAHLSLPLVERMEKVLGVLDMSKREFIESAIIEALDRYDSISDQYNIFEPYLVNNDKNSEAA